jgi:hypothetical protein
MAIDNIRHRLQAIYGDEARLLADRGDTTFTTTVSYPLRTPAET